MENLNFPSINDVKILSTEGPWTTKSSGYLSALMAIPHGIVQEKFFHYEPEELAITPADIRGLRIYTVDNLPKGTIGGTEFHKIRQEMVFCLRGIVCWFCEDIYGKKRVVTLEPGTGIWMPNYLLHTYTATEENSSLLVVANTLFFTDTGQTRDTYSTEEFAKLQKAFFQEL